MKKIGLKRLFNEYMNNLSGYLGKEKIRKLFYYKVYLMYLAQKNNLKLQIACFDEFLQYTGEKNKGFDLLLEELIEKYGEYNDITKEYMTLEDVKHAIEKNPIKEELDEKLYEELSKLTENEIIDIFIENSLEYKRYTNKENDASTKTIIELVVEILNINENEEVLDLCSGNGDFLTNLANNYKNLKLNGIEINEDTALISKIRLGASKENNAEIIVNDALTHNFEKKFDKIFCEYPLGLRVDNFRLNQQNNELYYKWNKPGLTTDWMFLNKIVTILKEKGTAALIITDGPLFKSMDTGCRKDILASGVVKYIIKLPMGILPNSNISANLIILSKGNQNNEIKFIDATQEYTENNQQEKELNVHAIMNLIVGNNNDENKVKIKQTNEIYCTEDAVLTVNSYVKKKEPNYINPHILKEFIIDKYRGYQFTAKEQAEITDINGDYELLTISDINDGIISETLLKINGNNNKYDRYLLQNGNIVISSKGTKIKIAVAEVGKRKIIPNGNLLVLRLNINKIEPYYLKAYLESENGKLSLEQIQTGAKIISINPSRIEQMNISMVNKESQKLFVEKYKRKMTELYLAEEHVKKLKEQIDNLFKNEIEEKYENE